MFNENDVRRYISENYNTLREIAGEVGFSESTLSAIQCGKQAIPEWMTNRVQADMNERLNKVGLCYG